MAVNTTAKAIAARLNDAQKKALMDMPEKPARFKRLSDVDKMFMRGICGVGSGWFVMGKIAYDVRDVLLKERGPI